MALTQASKRLMSKMVQAMPICIIMRELGRVSGGFLNRNRIQVCFLRDWLIHKQVFATVVFKKGSWIPHYCIQTTMLSFCTRFLTLYREWYSQRSQQPCALISMAKRR